MRTLFLMLALSAVEGLAPPASAAGKADVGTTTAPFLKLAPDPRAAAMGEAFTAGADEASAIFFNPAGLAGLDHMSVQLSQAFYVADISYQFIGYAQPLSALFHQFETGPGRLPDVTRLPDWGVLGLSALYVNTGSIDKVDNTGASLGSFTPSDLAASAAYARRFGDLDLGVTAKFVESKIASTAQTFAADAGVRWRTTLAERPLALAAAVRNAGGSLKYQSEAEPLPLTVALGSAWRPSDSVLVDLDLSLPNDNKAVVGLGAELTQPVNPDMKAAFRLGYRTLDTDAGLGGLTGLSAGAGLSFDFFRVDYAWVPFGTLGNSHRIGLTFRF